MSSKEIIKDTLKLSPQEKLFIVDSILKSLDEPDKDIEKIWTEEAEKRLRNYREGKIAGIPQNIFPYNLLFSSEKNNILILAAAHQHRRPFYWIEE